MVKDKWNKWGYLRGKYVIDAIGLTVVYRIYMYYVREARYLVAIEAKILPQFAMRILSLKLNSNWAEIVANSCLSCRVSLWICLTWFSSSFLFVVLFPPAFVEQPKELILYRAGSTVTLPCSATGNPRVEWVCGLFSPMTMQLLSERWRRKELPDFC